MASISA